MDFFFEKSTRFVADAGFLFEKRVATKLDKILKIITEKKLDRRFILFL
ncbi:hypothetical protein LEP1GSC016_3837 [Leptospira borgpetersenii serovar Hardjo-bovis str. Sponselee]|uniref:Uncharacterized protein n=2 Tax=Leptospira borgpetersenii TaxID=174 RepID=M6BZN4_LEPBO|nr:hypothetical protein LEP1GSC101_1730 [Leptospira borgpetersenii str. UI 09149]EMJ81873.1 hypothetical protein LEP1GSC016_3837 [Leptospira borgpetersenii serovar Hardjo-bovis str. Sponselee]EMN57453.1 hypothetical protein LEP1GSC090_2324 [Leptospira borgpetersenii serovar Javanica str. MK146]EPG58205.1 hypothetical protein LEP1GSC103_2227 [Leptospira borgpetersenii serovar Javanica str. UI 09931]